MTIRRDGQPTPALFTLQPLLSITTQQCLARSFHYRDRMSLPARFDVVAVRFQREATGVNGLYPVPSDLPA